MAAAIGLAAAMSFGAVPYVVPIVLNSCNIDINLATRAALAAQGQATALIGYVPGANARSGFQVTVKLPYRQASVKCATIINALLAVAGLDITLQFGAAGGVKILTCIPFSFSINGTEGQDITLQINYESVNFATVGQTVTAPGAFDNVWGFQDATSFTTPSTAVITKFNMFSFKGNRIRVAYVGNSPIGLPQNLGVAYTEVTHEGEYLKTSDAETTYFNGTGAPNYVQAPADCKTILTQVNPPSGQTTPTVDALTITATSCFYDTAPKNMGSETEWVREHVIAKASHGAWSVASA